MIFRKCQFSDFLTVWWTVLDNYPAKSDIIGSIGTTDFPYNFIAKEFPTTHSMQRNITQPILWTELKNIRYARVFLVKSNFFEDLTVFKKFSECS